jgi:hypothetical protein
VAVTTFVVRPATVGPFASESFQCLLGTGTSPVTGCVQPACQPVTPAIQRSSPAASAFRAPAPTCTVPPVPFTGTRATCQWPFCSHSICTTPEKSSRTVAVCARSSASSASSACALGNAERPTPSITATAITTPTMRP